MSVHSEDVLLSMKNCATCLQDALFLRKIEVDCIIEEESDAFCKDWISWLLRISTSVFTYL